jgi:hypothetical protein
MRRITITAANARRSTRSTINTERRIERPRERDVGATVEVT